MLAALGLDYVYLCQPVPRGRCREWLECAKFAGYAGFNATMPHKEELVELMDELDGDARLFENLCRASRRDNLDAEVLDERMRKLDDARFIGHRDERTLDPAF